MNDFAEIIVLAGIILSFLVGFIFFKFAAKEGLANFEATKIKISLAAAVLGLMAILVYCGQGLIVATLLPIFVIVITRLSRSNGTKN
jgi:hypothetical protein